MSENMLRCTTMLRMGYSNDDMTPHGFRPMARTLRVEKLNLLHNVIEAQLARTKARPLGATCDRAEFLSQRRQMMTVWADYLHDLRRSATVSPFKSA